MPKKHFGLILTEVSQAFVMDVSVDNCLCCDNGDVYCINIVCEDNCDLSGRWWWLGGGGVYLKIQISSVPQSSSFCELKSN